MITGPGKPFTKSGIIYKIDLFLLAEEDGDKVVAKKTKVTTASREPFLIEGNFSAQLSKNIKQEYNSLVKIVAKIPSKSRTTKSINGTGGYVSIADVIAYQIGWGKLIIGWYDIGVVKGEKPEMPGEGFTTWNYNGLAKHFYEKWQFDASQDQTKEFHSVVSRLIEIVEKEHRTGNLDKLGVWEWANLASGKPWPLSKWVQVNTAAPYKRAIKQIKPLVR